MAFINIKQKLNKLPSFKEKIKVLVHIAITIFFVSSIDFKFIASNFMWKMHTIYDLDNFWDFNKTFLDKYLDKLAGLTGGRGILAMANVKTLLEYLPINDPKTVVMPLEVLLLDLMEWMLQCYLSWKDFLVSLRIDTSLLGMGHLPDCRFPD